MPCHWGTEWGFTVVIFKVEIKYHLNQKPINSVMLFALKMIHFLEIKDDGSLWENESKMSGIPLFNLIIFTSHARETLFRLLKNILVFEK